MSSEENTNYSSVCPLVLPSVLLPDFPSSNRLSFVPYFSPFVHPSLFRPCHFPPLPPSDLTSFRPSFFFPSFFLAALPSFRPSFLPSLLLSVFPSIQPYPFRTLPVSDLTSFRPYLFLTRPLSYFTSFQSHHFPSFPLSVLFSFRPSFFSSFHVCFRLPILPYIPPFVRPSIFPSSPLSDLITSFGHSFYPSFSVRPSFTSFFHVCFRLPILQSFHWSVCLSVDVVIPSE